MKSRIYHNPRCSKSRAALALLHDRGIDPEVIEYLKTPPDGATLRALVRKLGVAPRDIVRAGEAEFKAAHVDLESASDAAVIALLVQHPKLLQRPIVEVDSAARVGRPPERVLELFE